MAERTVTTQADLDAALADDQAPAGTIFIDSPAGSPAGVWLRIGEDSSRVVACGSSRVVACGSSRVVACGSSHVVAWDSSRVVACGSSRVVAWDSSRVEAWDSSHVEAWDSSHVEAWDSSRVVACGSSRVEAWGSSHVEAWGSSHVEAGIAVAVHLHSAAVTVSGGTVIDVTQIDLTDLRTWLAYTGVKVDDTGRARLFKAVDADLRAGHEHTLTEYPIGGTVAAPDWDPAPKCGHGLHFGVSPSHARRYYGGSGAPRFLEVEVDAAGLVPLGDKVKAKSCVVVREVTVHGEPVEVTE